MRGQNITGREALRMKAHDGMSVTEIARRLGKTVPGVINAMKRATGEGRTTSAALVAAVAAREAEIDARRVQRDPCVRCAVPRDRHAEHGCRSYRAS